MTRTISRLSRCALRSTTRSAACVLILLTLCLVPALAEDYYGAEDWACSFSGKALETNFTSDTLSDQVTAMEPGDSLTMDIAVKNDGTAAMDFYMANEILQSLEDSTSASGGAYTYTLSYTDPNGETTVLFDSDTVGGETGGSTPEGLHSATSSLEDFFFLDTLAAGEGGSVRLYVALDGESQGNSYQNTAAKIRLNFAVEQNASAANQATPARNSSGTSSTTVYDRSYQNVRTGDAIRLGLWGTLALLSLGFILFVLLSGRKAGKDYE